jgi:two-component system LytT family response regulator
MTILVLEDEAPARAWLTQVLARHRPNATVTALASVADALAWLASHPAPDLILADIQLADGLSLEIFERAQPGCPVIFTTAYDEYLVEAMQRDGIAYLLKPLREEDVAGALAKYDRLESHFTGRMRGLLDAWLGERATPITKTRDGATDPSADRSHIIADTDGSANALRSRVPTDADGSANGDAARSRIAAAGDESSNAEPARSRIGAPSRLVARRRDGFVVLSLAEIAYFVVVDKLVDVVTRDGRRFAVDQTLGELERDLADEVFRVNRQYLVHASAVAGFRPFVKGKLLIELAPAATEEVIVSQENAARFRAWLAG